MQAVTTPTFDELGLALSKVNTTCSGAELHGVMSGLLAGGARLNRQALIKALESHTNADQPFNDETVAKLWQLQLESLENLNGSDLSFSPLLPDDDTPLKQRVDAMSEWCQGFLVGFGMAARPQDTRIQGEAVKDTLQDLVHITQVESSDEEDEESEVAYAELFEFVRMAAIHLFEEMTPVEEKDPASDKPTLH